MARGPRTGRRLILYALRRPLERAGWEFEGRETATRFEEGPKLGTYAAVVDARKRIPRTGDKLTKSNRTVVVVL